MAPKRKISAAPIEPVVDAIVPETDTPPPKTKSTKKRSASSIASADPTGASNEPAKRSKAPSGPSIMQMLRRPIPVDTAVHLTPEKEKAAPPTEMEAAIAKPALPVQKELASEPPTEMEVAIEKTALPVQKDLASEHAHMSELLVGSVTYTCLCTRDSATAGAWADLVMQDVKASEAQAEQAVNVLGVDCEWAPPWHRGPGVPDRIATLQVFHNGSAGRRALVFSVAGLGGELPPSVVALLGDSRLAKVGVNVAGDATRLMRDFGCPVRGLYDLSNLNKKAGQKLRKAVSLEDLVRTHCPDDMHITKSEVAMTKGVRTSNWEAWPLSAEQIEYAAKDAVLGVMAFSFKFGMDSSQPQLSALAVEALVELGEVTSESVANANAKAATAKASTKRKNSGVANDSDSPAVKDAESPPADADTDKQGEKKDNKQHFFLAMRNSVLKAPNIGKKDHPKGPKDALAHVCIVVSGILDSFERKDMEQYVMDHGGKTSKSVTGKVTHLVTDHGEAGPSKVAKCKELGIPCVSEDVILQLVSDKMQ